MHTGSPWIHSGRIRHGLLLAVFLLPFLLAPWLAADSHTVRCGTLHLPECALAQLFPGLGCPGCGLTRSVVLALHGDLRAAFAVHPVGILVVLLAAAGAVAQLRALRHDGAAPEMARVSRMARWILTASLLAAWLGRLL